jgi:hypothetical protein
LSPAYKVWRRGPSGNCSYSATFSQKADSTAMVLIGETIEVVRRSDFLRRHEGSVQLTVHLIRQYLRQMPEKGTGTLANAFQTCAKRKFSTRLCAAMILEEKVMNLQPQYPVPRLS